MTFLRSPRFCRIEELEPRCLLSSPLKSDAVPRAALPSGDPIFIDHGAAVPISVSRGAVGAVDGTGRDVFLMWLRDHRGTYSIMQIDVLTGATTQVPIPGFNASTAVDDPYYSILYNNRFYTHFNYQFLEYNPATASFSFASSTVDRRAMSMTVSDSGVIWSVSNPDCGVVKFDTTTRVFTDFGPRYSQSYDQYPTFCATDDQGWLYIGDGPTSSQILAVNPSTGATTALLSAGERLSGTGYVYRNLDGKVYGRQLQNSGAWYRLYNGARTTLTSHTISAKTYIAGNQNLFIGTNFASGRKVVSCNVVSRVLTYENAGSTTRYTSNFSYTTEGAVVMSMTATADGRIAGGGAFPMYQYELNTTTNSFIYSNIAGGQWNTVYRRGNHVYVGAYSSGTLLDWDTTQPWTLTSSGTSSTNPKALVSSGLPTISRPGGVYVTPDGQYVLMGGIPGAGLTGGGLIIYNLSTNTYVTRTDTQLIANESPFSIVSLDATHVLIGTTIAPGSGGVQVSTNAHLFILDLTTNAVTWSGTPFTGAGTYLNLYKGSNGLVYGVLDTDTFFAFNPTTKALVQSQSLTAWGKSASSQGPRIFCETPHGTYVLLANYIAKLNFTTNLLETVVALPTAANVGLDYVNGRLYYVASDQSRIWSWEVDVTAPTLQSGSFSYDGVLLPAAPHRVTLQFSEDVGATLSASDITLTNTTTSQTVSLVAGDLTWNSATLIATLTFSQLANKQLSDGVYTLSLNSSGVRDAAGNALAAGSGFSFFSLGADSNHDGKVNTFDFNVLAGSFGGTGKHFGQGNFDYDALGKVDSVDAGTLFGRYGKSFGPSSATAMAANLLFEEQSIESRDFVV